MTRTEHKKNNTIHAESRRRRNKHITLNTFRYFFYINKNESIKNTELSPWYGQLFAGCEV